MDPVYIAHRGVSFQDNSIHAIRQAVACDAYAGVEIDVQLCKSGEIVLHHDLTIHGHWIKDLDYDDLKPYDIVSLAEVYTTLPSIQEKMLLVDVKGNDYAIVDALEDFFMSKDTSLVYFCSFNAPLVMRLGGRFKKGRTFECFFHPGEYEVVTRGFDAVVVHWTCLNRTLVEYCHTMNIKVFSYTHKEAIELRHMLANGVDGVITNDHLFHTDTK